MEVGFAACSSLTCRHQELSSRVAETTRDLTTAIRVLHLETQVAIVRSFSALRRIRMTSTEEALQNDPHCVAASG